MSIGAVEMDSLPLRYFYNYVVFLENMVAENERMAARMESQRRGQT